MGTRAEIQAAVAEAFAATDALADFVETFTFKWNQKNATPVYDPVTDTYTNSTPMTSACKGIFNRVAASSVDGINILFDDEEIIVNGPDCLIVPDANMTIETASGKKYRVIDPGKVTGGDVAATVYLIQVRIDRAGV